MEKLNKKIDINDIFRIRISAQGEDPAYLDEVQDDDPALTEPRVWLAQPVVKVIDEVASIHDLLLDMIKMGRINKSIRVTKFLDAVRELSSAVENIDEDDNYDD